MQLIVLNALFCTAPVTKDFTLQQDKDYIENRKGSFEPSAVLRLGSMSCALANMMDCMQVDLGHMASVDMCIVLLMVSNTFPVI